MTLRESLANTLRNDHGTETYMESTLAFATSANHRLIGQNMQLSGLLGYVMPRIIRFAALMGDKYMEVDFPASHGRQILLYA